MKTVAIITALAFLGWFQALTENQRVINGVKAKPGQFPWEVSYQSQNPGTVGFKHRCGGSLITTRHVLTAAHCIRFPNKSYQIVAGALNISDINEPSRQAIPVCKNRTHPKYIYQPEKGHINSDFAILTLERPVRVTDRVQPIRLAPADADPVGKTCSIAGWGDPSPDEIHGIPNFSDVLLAVNLTIISQQECQDFWAGERVIDESIICGKPKTVGLSGSAGDSGGSLTCFDDNGPYLAGVVSFGSVFNLSSYTIESLGRVSYARDFITCQG